MIRTESVFVFVVCILFCFFAEARYNFSEPKPQFTPGYLCTADDPNFSGYDFQEKIARCKRNVTETEKNQVAIAYGISKSSWPNYEFDHLIPLGIGGSDDIRNIWPQPLTEAHQKDVIENEVYNGMRAGTMTQAQAVQKIKDWFASRGAHVIPSLD